MKIDDYDLYEQDFDEFVRRGREAFGIDDQRRDGFKELKQDYNQN